MNTQEKAGSLSHSDIIKQERKRKSKHFDVLFTEYLSWINVTGPALPCTTFALPLRLPFTSERAISVWQWLSSRFAFNVQLSD